MNIIVEQVEYKPASLTDRLSFTAVFGRIAPVEMDLGCGDGTFLTQLAANNPDRNFLGIERLLRRVRTAGRKAAQLNLENVRMLPVEVSYAMSHLIASETVSVIHFLFPDPWPKRRHHRRRTFTGDFLLAVHRALMPKGLFHVTTDDADYYRQMQQVIAALGLFTPVTQVPKFPTTKFERRFMAQGATIYRLVLRKVAPVR